jgi:O-antigen biosynthesis protein
LKQLKVLFLPTANAGVTFYRMLQYFRHIQKLPDMNPAMDKFDPNRATPYEWQFKHNASATLFAQIEKLISQADIVVIGYILTDQGVAILQAIKTEFPDKPIVMEIDDYCNEVNYYSPSAPVFKPYSESTNAIMEQLTLSDMVVVSTPYLKGLYTFFNKNIKVVPNGMDFSIWDNLKDAPKKGKKVRIGWAASSAHGEDLRFIEKVVLKLLYKYPNIEFSFFGGVPDFFIGKDKRIKTVRKWVNVYEYPQTLKNLNLDIGIAPLLDNNFNRSKSNLRWLEYSALKIPTVASRVEDFKRTIKDRVTGCLATELDEWEKKLSELIEDEPLRKWLGHNAYNEVKEKFNVETISRDYSKILWEKYNDFRRPKK